MSSHVTVLNLPSLSSRCNGPELGVLRITRHVKDFCICVHWGHWPVIFFSCVFPSFGYQGNIGLVK